MKEGTPEGCCNGTNDSRRIGSMGGVVGNAVGMVVVGDTEGSELPVSSSVKASMAFSSRSCIRLRDRRCAA